MCANQAKMSHFNFSRNLFPFILQKFRRFFFSRRTYDDLCCCKNETFSRNFQTLWRVTRPTNCVIFMWPQFQALEKLKFFWLKKCFNSQECNKLLMATVFKNPHKCLLFTLKNDSFLIFSYQKMFKIEFVDFIVFFFYSKSNYFERL